MPHNSHMRHLGGGPAGTALDLPPGKHSLQLIIGDSDNVPHDPPLISQKIEIEVKSAASTLKKHEAPGGLDPRRRIGQAIG